MSRGEGDALHAVLEQLLQRGEAQFIDGDLVSARRVFGTVLDAAPGHAVAWNDLGTVLHAERRFDEAEQAFLRAAVFAPESPVALVNLVRLAAQRGDQPLAGALLERLGRFHPAERDSLAAELAAPDLSGVEVLCVGSSPSSGSTMLADLLDSLPGVACGPESNIFCHAAAYAPGGAPGWAERPQPRPSIYMPPLHFFSPILEEVGLSLQGRRDLIEGAADLQGFVDRYRAYYGGFRQREIRVLADKTPVNVNCLPQFCTYFGPRGLFVHLVRDGRAVAASLTGRGFTLYEAACVWMAQVTRGMQARRFGNAVELRYEDILSSGFEVLAELAAVIGIEVAPDEIEKRYADNSYRGGLTRVGSWSVPAFTGQIEATRSYRERLDPVVIATLQRVVTLPIDAPGAPPPGVAFAELLAAYEYPLDAPAVDEDRIRACFAKLEGEYLGASRPRLAIGRPLLALSDPP